MTGLGKPCPVMYSDVPLGPISLMKSAELRSWKRLLSLIARREVYRLIEGTDDVTRMKHASLQLRYASTHSCAERTHVRVRIEVTPSFLKLSQRFLMNSSRAIADSLCT